MKKLDDLEQEFLNRSVLGMTTWNVQRLGTNFFAESELSETSTSSSQVTDDGAQQILSPQNKNKSKKKRKKRKKKKKKIDLNDFFFDDIQINKEPESNKEHSNENFLEDMCFDDIQE